MKHRFKVGDKVTALINGSFWKSYTVTNIVKDVKSKSYVLTDEDGNVILKYEDLMKLDTRTERD